MTIPTEERGIAHRRDTREMGVGRDGRVIDLHVLTVGERAGGVEGGKGVGGVVYCAVRMRLERRRWY
jgi:hypothetical protein